MEEKNMDKIIEQFHQLWDGFPGLARLITSKREIIAANANAIEAGYAPGCICAKIGDPASHQGCKLETALQTGTPQIQKFGVKIKGWNPIEGYPELCVHWVVVIPEAE